MPPSPNITRPPLAPGKTPAARLFGALLSKKLKQTGLSHRAWAEKHGLSYNSVRNAAAGYFSPSGSAADAWAKALGLTGDARKEFVTLAQAGKASRQSRAKPHVDRLERQLSDLERMATSGAAEIAAMSARIKALDGEVETLRAGKADLAEQVARLTRNSAQTRDILLKILAEAGDAGCDSDTWRTQTVARLAPILVTLL
jgi:hypothetical protein